MRWSASASCAAVAKRLPTWYVDFVLGDTVFAWVLFVVPLVVGGCFAQTVVDNPEIHGVLMVDGHAAPGLRVVLRDGPLFGSTKTAPCAVANIPPDTIAYTTGAGGEFAFAKRMHSDGRSMLPSMDRSFAWRLCMVPSSGPAITLACDHGMAAARPVDYLCTIDSVSHAAHCTVPPTLGWLECPD
jgi:hypothetical protein